MQRSRSPRRRLTVEVMEDRLTPASGVPWLDPGALTLSFMPDGTDVTGKPSNLSSLLGTSSPATWQREILRAFQTWASQTNLNVGVVPDSGLPEGTAGSPQGDPRFGDIRVGARPLSSGQNDSVGQATGFDVGGGTWSGDLMLNSKFPIAAGGTDPQHYDLYSVALHEAGHSLGLGDNDTDPTAVMYGEYKVDTGLGAADVKAIKALYGARTDDPYEGSGGNDTPATAYDLTRNGNLTGFSADLTRAGDVDYYKFTTPGSASGVTSLTVNLQAAGVSLLTARVTVTDANGNTVGTAAATDPLANNVSVPVGNYQPSATYFVRVEGSGTDVFSTGAYNLRLSYNKAVGTSNVKLGMPSPNYDNSTNRTLATAQALGQLASLNTPTFAVAGYLADPTNGDWYRVTPQSSSLAAGTLTVSVWPAQANGLLPTLKVYDAAGRPVTATVVANENGTFTVQVPNQAAGTTYNIQVLAADPGGSRNTGTYVMGANLAPAAAIQFDSLSTDTLTGSQAVAYSTMTVGEARLTQFAFNADAGGVDAAVRVTIFDAQGHKVFTLVANAGRQLTTGTVWLEAGTYTVVYNAAARSGSLDHLTYALQKRERSDPIEPYPIDPYQQPTSPPPPPPGQPPPPPPPVVTTSPPVVAPPPGAAVGPIADPYANC